MTGWEASRAWVFATSLHAGDRIQWLNTDATDRVVSVRRNGDRVTVVHVDPDGVTHTRVWTRARLVPMSLQPVGVDPVG